MASWLRTAMSYRITKTLTLDTSVIGKGSFGMVVPVKNEDGRCKKISSLFYDSGSFVAASVIEFIAYMHIRNSLHANNESVPRVDSPVISGDTIQFHMEAGGPDLRTYTKTILADQIPELREKTIDDIAEQIMRCLLDVHSSGLAHGDLKPSNIVMFDGKVKLVDFGSANFLNRADHFQQAGTYPFMPKEVFLSGEVNMRMVDAYSLGATIFYMATGGRYLYDVSKYNTQSRVKKMYVRGDFKRPSTEPPSGVTLRTWQLMHSLLFSGFSIADALLAFRHEDPPAKRQKVDVDGFRICDPTLTSVHTSRKSRVHAMYVICLKHDVLHAFALAVNVADRYMAASGRPCTVDEVFGCVILAELLTGKTTLRVEERESRGALAVLETLAFDVYSDTCDVILLRMHKIDAIKYDVLREVLSKTHLTTVAVRLYREVVS